MILPSSFKIANQEYNVILVDYLDSRNFGEFDCIECEIRIARTVKSAYDEEYHELTDEQILNTFWHELFHCFNWHLDNETDEAIAQSFANFMREFESTKSYEADSD